MLHEPRLTHAQAVAKVVTTEPALYLAYQHAEPTEERAAVSSVDVEKRAALLTIRTEAEQLAKAENVSLVDALVKLGQQRARAVQKENPQPPSQVTNPSPSITAEDIAALVRDAHALASQSDMSLLEALILVCQQRLAQEQSDQGGMAQPTRAPASKAAVRVAKAAPREAWLEKLAREADVSIEILRKCARDSGLLAAA